MLLSSNSSFISSNESHGQLLTSNSASNCDKKKSMAEYKKNSRERPRSKSGNRSKNTIKPYSPSKLTSKNSEDFLHIFITLGATSDFARKIIYPTLWNLYKNSLLPINIQFYGFSKISLTLDELREKSSEYITIEPGEGKRFDDFWKLNHHYVGNYCARVDFELFNKELCNYEWTHNSSNRIYYIALPNSMIETVTQNLKTMSNPSRNGWTRIVIDRPYCKDEASSEKLTQHILSLFKEDEIYRIDQYLGKSSIQNLVTLRFSNLLFSSTWNRKFIQCVMITIKDPYGIQEKCKNFDSYGVIRELMLTHSLNILSVVAMEKPVSFCDEHVRDEKVKVLKCTEPVNIEDVILGQYIGVPYSSDDNKIGYTDEPDIPRNSVTPTFCVAVVKINNERWDGVPFILKCGKALNEKKVEICIQYQDVPGNIYNEKPNRNELIIQTEPIEKVYIKVMRQTSNELLFDIEESELPFVVKEREKNYEAYERLLLQVFTGIKTNFTRSDELSQAWRIFTPLLNKIEVNHVRPYKYFNGTDGPVEAQQLFKKYRFLQNTEIQ